MRPEIKVEIEVESGEFFHTRHVLLCQGGTIWMRRRWWWWLWRAGKTRMGI